ncbi:hypothetical protein [Aliikangiella coralliicola]|uniref:Uncharacterized protein n=1 Tax=Aliikangiella coralliicola TaxID=2592383 RepID=A0A545UCB0_9GAMM|nr:hypothetical protein [Aliikangiella coralliicola]TQV87099.1 hypothetical protein FLL46_14940 [Aliikangiella coralliicola]
MIKFSKLAVSAAVCLVLTGCFEVEDKSHDEVAAALEEQNAAIQDQKTPITVFGSIVDAATDEVITDATVRLKIGGQWQGAIAVSGEFSIDNLPANTDIVVLVQSPSGAFLDRAFYGKTETVAAGQEAHQAIGKLRVSEGVEKSYAILDTENSEAVEGLKFSYSTSSSFSPNYNYGSLNNYKTESTFDSETGLYRITLPKDLPFVLTAPGDIDGDDIVDYSPENNSYWRYDSIYLQSDDALNLETLYLNESLAYQAIEFRIKMIDSLGNAFENLEIFAHDQYLGRVDVSFDAETQEHVFNYQSSSGVELLMPSFTTDEDVIFQSGRINLNWSSTRLLSVHSNGFRNNLSGTVEVVDGVHSVILQPYETSTPSSDYNRIVSSVIDENQNFSLKQFFELPVALLDNSVALSRENILSVTKGNASASDIVPLGTTKIEYLSEALTTSTTLTHNDTFLAVVPEQALPSGRYQYRVTELVNRESENRYVPNFTKLFDVPATGLVFDINDVKLDNNNGSVNGAVIVTQNTAGETAPAPYSWYGSTSLYLPTSIESLDFLEFRLVSTVNNNTVRFYDNRIRIIDSQYNNANKVHLVSLATNEDVQVVSGQGINVRTKTSLEDGLVYTYSSGGVSSYENQPGYTNTATYQYTYRVRGEDTAHEGTITLPVL